MSRSWDVGTCFKEIRHLTLTGLMSQRRHFPFTSGNKPDLSLLLEFFFQITDCNGFFMVPFY